MRVKDSFNRSDENPLSDGGRWTGNYQSDAQRNLKIVSNVVQATTLSIGAYMTRTEGVSDDQKTQVDIATWNTTADLFAGPLLRWAASPTRSGYRYIAVHDATSVKSAIERWDNGTPTVIGSETASGAWQAGDAILGMAKGTTETLYRIRGGVKTKLLEATDSNYTGGKVGVSIANFNASLGDIEIDNFIGGEHIGGVLSHWP